LTEFGSKTEFLRMDIGEITGSWDYGALPDNIRIGKNCFLERREAFDRFRSRQNPGLILGDRVQVLTWTTFNVEPTGIVIVGDDTLLAGAVFMCAESIRIGARCVVSYNVTIADCDFHPIDVEARRRDAIATSPSSDRSDRPPLLTRPVIIGDDVRIGTGAIILKGVHIGDRATVAPGTVLACAVPADSLAIGNPAVIAEKRQ
jgi:acetyltransferase-like isoleucine patch superfamily enzyme